ncbi:MAG: DNA replication/repair protein RecF [Pyrinomonadaceae bacterium]
MLLESLETWNFRNTNGKINLSNGLNIFSGENGAGKTNWLEAISVLASAKAFRTPRLQETVRFGEKEAQITGSVRESPEIVRELRVSISGNSKILSINGKREAAGSYLGHLHVVVFNADELEVVRGQPDERRRFLDAGIVGLHPPFSRVFADYNRVIKQKNALLQNAQDELQRIDETAKALEPWNQQLTALGTKIHKARLRFVERLNEVLEKKLFGREELSIRYASSLEEKGDMSDYENLLAERLKVRLQAETAAGYSLIGPHRDDLEIKFDGHDMRKFGSAGQQRSALLLLELANIAVFEATRGEYPLFLLDDIDAELDYKRIGKLLEFLEGKTQTFVTTSKESFVERFGHLGKLFRISGGEAKSN